MEIGREMFQKESGLKRGVSSDWVFRKGKVSERKWSQKGGPQTGFLGRERFQTESCLKRGVSSDWVFRKGKVSDRKWSQKRGVLRLGFRKGKVSDRKWS